MGSRSISISVVSHDWASHGRHSGYEFIREYLPFARIVQPVRIPYRIGRWFARRAKIRNYMTTSVFREIGVLRDVLRHRPELVHYLYGDHDYFYASRFRRLSPKTKWIATFHHPPAEIADRQQFANKEFLRGLDGIICVGSNQAEYFSEYVGHERVFVVPHGIDTDFFCPGPTVERDPRHILVVGASHRDDKTLEFALRALKQRYFSLKTTVVGGTKNLSESLDGLNWIQFRSSITDNELLELYRRVSCVLLILGDCTASNALLETIATGCPLVVTDVGGVRDYIDEQCALLVRPRSPDDVIGAVIALFDDPEIGRKIGMSARQQALRFAWPIVAQQTLAVYQAVLSSRLLRRTLDAGY